MGYYVYKYEENNEIVYIGKTIHLKERIQQHEHDKLKNFNGNIYYFECENETAMNSWEFFLINKHHPIHNVVFNNPSQTIQIEEPQWHLYSAANLKLYKPSPKTKRDYTHHTLRVLSSSYPQAMVDASVAHHLKGYNDDTYEYHMKISVKEPIIFKCKHCKTVFESTAWTWTKKKHHSAWCPVCFRSAWVA